MVSLHNWRDGGQIISISYPPGAVVDNTAFNLPVRSPPIAINGGVRGLNTGLVRAAVKRLAEGAPNTYARQELTIVADSASLAVGSISRVGPLAVRVNVDGSGAAPFDADNLLAQDELDLTYVIAPENQSATGGLPPPALP